VNSSVERRYRTALLVLSERAASGERPDGVLTVLRGMLDARFVERFSEVLNVHPAFLPLDPRHDDVGMPDGSRIPAFRGARRARTAPRPVSPGRTG